MGRYVFKLPDIGEGTIEAEIVAWHVAVGDGIEEDQPLVDVMTNKATVEMTSPVSGRVAAVNGQLGDRVAVGSELVVLEVEGAGNADVVIPDAGIYAESRSSLVALSASSAPLDPGVRRDDEGAIQRPLCSPAVRRRARELGVNLDLVPGTGPAGRISQENLAAYVAKERPAGPARREGVEAVKIIGLRRKIAEKMQESKRHIPHFAYIEELDVTALEELRLHLNESRKAGRPKLTLLPFLMRALVKLLPDYPQINARYDDEAGILHRFQGVHIGIATQTPGGLMVPVVRHAEALDLWASAREITRLAEAAREGKATAEELSGSTITVTSLGALGGVAAAPVINYPEVAIIGPNRIIERPVVRSGQIVVRKMMNLSSSFDHRIVDGYDAAAFIQKIKTLLENPATLFMDQE